METIQILRDIIVWSFERKSIACIYPTQLADVNALHLILYIHIFFLWPLCTCVFTSTKSETVRYT